MSNVEHVIIDEELVWLFKDEPGQTRAFRELLGRAAREFIEDLQKKFSEVVNDANNLAA